MNRSHFSSVSMETVKEGGDVMGPVGGDLRRHRVHLKLDQAPSPASL